MIHDEKLNGLLDERKAARRTADAKKGEWDIACREVRRVESLIEDRRQELIDEINADPDQNSP